MISDCKTRTCHTMLNLSLLVFLVVPGNAFEGYCKPIEKSVVQVEHRPFRAFVRASPDFCQPAKLEWTKRYEEYIYDNFTLNLNFHGQTNSTKLFENEPCTTGWEYDFSVLDTDNNTVKFTYSCVRYEIKKFRKLVPVVWEVRANQIKLDMYQSLVQFPRATAFEVFYSLQKRRNGTWESVPYMRTDGRFLTVENLMQRTKYYIKMVWKVPNKNNSDRLIYSTMTEQWTNPCIPIDESFLELRYEPPQTVVARLKNDLVEDTQICWFTKVKLISDNMVLEDERVRGSEVEIAWKLPPCHPGSKVYFRLEDSQGSYMHMDGNCMQNPTNPDKISWINQ